MRRRSRSGHYYTRPNGLGIGLFSLLFSGLRHVSANKSNDMSHEEEEKLKNFALAIPMICLIGIGIIYLILLPGNLKMNRKYENAERLVTQWIMEHYKDRDSFYLTSVKATYDQYYTGGAIKVDASFQYQDIYDSSTKEKHLYEEDYTFWIDPANMKLDLPQCYHRLWDLTANHEGSY